MREIKFRAWDVPNKEMLDHQMIDDAFGFRIFDNDPDDFIPMQYTGLTDKSGRPIYEGDIVITGQIDSVYNPVEWQAVVEFKKGAFVADDGLLSDAETNFPYEVIGNIYENPELLEQEK